MPASVDKLTIAEFEQYGDRKPYHEFWFGEAVAKSVPTHRLCAKWGIRTIIVLDPAPVVEELDRRAKRK